MRMLRSVLIAGGATAALAVVAPAAPAASPARVRLEKCRTALEQANRYAVFTGSMDSLRTGNRLAMRFVLYRRASGANAFERVAAPGLGVWHRAKRGVPAYRFRQRVENLSAPADYRVRVTFRWAGPAGKPTVVKRRTSAVCSQPDLRPDLRVAIKSVTPAGAGQADYTLAVRNAGRSFAGKRRGFDVALSVGGVAQPAVTVSGLKAGKRRLVTFRAPRCTAGSTVAAAVDPDGRVEEADEANNAASRVCAAARRR